MGDEGVFGPIADGRRFFYFNLGGSHAEAVDFVHVARTFLRDRLLSCGRVKAVEQSAGQAHRAGLRRELTPADTSWVLISTALVLLMTPGLAFFYGGMVGRKNILACSWQCFGLLCVVSIQWVVFGYSLSFAPGNSFWGGFEWQG